MVRRYLVVVAAIAALGTGVALAQDKPLRWHVFGEWTPVQGVAQDYLDDGYGLGFGAIWSPSAKRSNLGLRFDLAWDQWDVKTGAIPTGEFRVDDGDASSWSLRTGLHAEASRGRTRFYGGVGLGGYSLYAEATNTVLVPGYICDPWYWWICYPGLVEGEVIVDDESTTKLGYYANLGISWEMGNGEGFLEATYHWVDLKETFEFFPVTLGYRW